jgi:DNA repair exonuclease SbcCD nuclease subunit
MRIAVISDLHLGYAAGTEREEDCYEAAAEAVEKAREADAIILAGDLFDSRTPGTDALVRAMEILAAPVFRSSSGARITGGIGREVSAPLSPAGIPVIAIHGTHERRVRGFLNPVEALERAGFLTYLHCNGVVLRKEGDVVCVQGMSGVPEHYAEAVLKEWGPRPAEGYNIIVFHQSIAPFMYAPAMLPVESIPKGFDLYVNGHVHEPRKAEYAGAPFLLPGSLIPTQMGRDSVERKGFFMVDTGTGGADFVRLERQRDFYYEDLSGAREDEAERLLAAMAGKAHGKKPLVSLRVRGRPEWLDRLKEAFQDRLIIHVIRKDPERPEREAMSLEEHRLSARELGGRLLRENLRKEGLDPETYERLFELLEERRLEDALSYLKERAGLDGRASPDAHPREGEASADAHPREGEASADAHPREGEASADAHPREGEASADAHPREGNSFYSRPTTA